MNHSQTYISASYLESQTYISSSYQELLEYKWFHSLTLLRISLCLKANHGQEHLSGLGRNCIFKLFIHFWMWSWIFTHFFSHRKFPCLPRYHPLSVFPSYLFPASVLFLVTPVTHLVSQYLSSFVLPLLAFMLFLTSIHSSALSYYLWDSIQSHWISKLYWFVC